MQNIFSIKYVRQNYEQINYKYYFFFLKSHIFLKKKRGFIYK